MNVEEQLQLVADIAGEGIIGVDRAGIITLFNRKAKEITGIILNGKLAHPAGNIKQGDIVLLADNQLGGDDGGLTPKDLEVLGIRDGRLEAGDAVLAVGVYQNIEIEPLYHFWKPQTAERALQLGGTYLGLSVSLAVDRGEKEISITVNTVTYRIRYLKAISNLVVVDGATGCVKFFQEKGYTMRREDVRNVLWGRPYQAKGKGAAEFNVLGANFFDLVEPCELTRRLVQVLSGETPAVIDEPFELNYRLMQTAMRPMVRDGIIEGAVLKVVDLSDMCGLLKERNELIAQVEEAEQGLESASLRVPSGSFRNFAGSSATIQQVKYLAYRAAKARCNVIITGESGTGKSQLAKEIHELSRPGKPFVEVNCGSISSSIFESELFGYVGGAFTGALTGGKTGYLEQAEHGTLFLDELGEIPHDIQVKLLYVLQNKRFYRVGSTKAIDADVRILCATNRDLRKEVKEGRFREDLYYRVNVFPIEIPPLRERKSDIYVLSKSLTEHVCSAYDLAPKQLSAWALDKLLQYDWPGNIRELGNVIERAVVICDGSIIYPEFIELEGVDDKADHPADMEWSTEGRSMRNVLEYTESRTLRSAMARFDGDKRKAMEMLGMKKSTFYERLQYYHIEG